jgi:hypothetical protein
LGKHIPQPLKFKVALGKPDGMIVVRHYSCSSDRRRSTVLGLRYASPNLDASGLGTACVTAILAVERLTHQVADPHD